MKEYQTEFESLANRITGLPPQFYLSCFISGLKPEIRREVQAFQPISLSHAISLVKLQKEKQNDRFSSFSSRRSHEPRNPPPRPTVNTSPVTTITTTAPKTPLPIKQLSPAELQAHRDKGLCYNCDDRWTAGHRCKRQFHLLVAILETPEPHEDPLSQLLLASSSQNLPETQTEPSPDPTHTIDPHQAQISLHALLGHPIPQTLRVLGCIAKTQVAILIDGGSTNNFIQERVAKRLGLPLKPAQTFQVLVGNGEELQCSTICPQVCIILGPHQFWVDLFVVPLRGAKLVLGVEWLKSLGPVFTDYNELTTSFIKDGQIVQLKGETQFDQKKKKQPSIN